MESLLVFLLISVLTTEGRLIQINRTKIEEPKTDKPNPSIRLTRDIDYILGFSNEETGQDDEFVTSYNSRASNFYKKSVKESSDYKGTRYIRDSSESVKDHTKNTAPKISSTPNKFKTVLVKKPIPKFKELDYDDDFQAKMNKFLTVVIDSGDHEDEDFNVDDYDFDVNHDEYAGRGKHLEPRNSAKRIEVTTAKVNKIPSNVRKISTPTAKKERSIKGTKASKVRDDDYYEDKTIKRNNTRDDSEYEDSYDSTETDNKNSSRTIRSWNITRLANVLGGKSAPVVSNILSTLSLFPQMPTVPEFDLQEYQLTLD